MHLQLAALGLLSLVPHVLAQGVGVGAVGAPTATLGGTQMPSTTNAPSLVTVGGVTSAQTIMFTIPFATTPLGGWDLGPTPLPGSIGLGNIQGNIGTIKSKRAVETPVS